MLTDIFTSRNSKEFAEKGQVFGWMQFRLSGGGIIVRENSLWTVHFEDALLPCCNLLSVFYTSITSPTALWSFGYWLLFFCRKIFLHHLIRFSRHVMARHICWCVRIICLYVRWRNNNNRQAVRLLLSRPSCSSWYSIKGRKGRENR